MGRQAVVVLYVLAIVVVVVGVDVLFFRDQRRRGDSERRDCPGVHRCLFVVPAECVGAACWWRRRDTSIRLARELPEWLLPQAAALATLAARALRRLAGRVADTGQEGHDGSNHADIRPGTRRGPVSRVDRSPAHSQGRIHVPSAVHAASTSERMVADQREARIQLLAEGRMHPFGVLQVKPAKADGRWDAAYAGSAEIDVPEDVERALATNAGCPSDVRSAHSPEPLRDPVPGQPERSAPRHGPDGSPRSSRCSRGAKRSIPVVAAITTRPDRAPRRVAPDTVSSRCKSTSDTKRIAAARSLEAVRLRHPT